MEKISIEMLLPTHKNIICKHSEVNEARTKTGLYIPTGEIEFVTLEAVSVGPNCQVVKPGDRVLVAKNYIQQVEDGLDELKISMVTEDSVLLAIRA